jgi:hypothetical protein
VSSWFRRRGTDRAEETENILDTDTDTELDDEEETSSALSRRPDGPWDVSERPEVEGLIDLGALRLRGRDGMHLRLDVEKSSGAINTATVQIDGSALQLQAFAAPRTEGIWPEISTEITTSILRQGGKVTESTGVYGRELLARIPRTGEDGPNRLQSVRFIGVDGPRWFLRAVIHGPAAEEPNRAEPLEDLLRDVVVVRGSQAMAPRDLLPLRLPPQARSAEQEADTDEAANRPGEGDQPVIDPYHRGPEITEIR